MLSRRFAKMGQVIFNLIHSTDTKNQSAKALTILFYALLIYSLVLVIPSSFESTLPALDASWPYALNYFIHTRFRFGPDLIFTYGPLGFLANPLHIGHDIPIAVMAHAICLFVLGAQLVSVWRSRYKLAAFMLCISLVLGHRLYYDYWDYDLLAVGLITVSRLFQNRPTYLDLIALPLLLGVGFLLKFTTFAALVLMLIPYTVCLLLTRPLTRARILWLVACFFSGPAAYFIYDTSLKHLVQYVKGSLQVATGFATAMTSDSDPRSWALAVAICAILAANLAICVWKQSLSVSFAFVTILVTWVVFRHGFVRADPGHTALFFGFSPLIFSTLAMGWRTINPPRTFISRLPELCLTLSFFPLGFMALTGIASHYPVFIRTNWWPQQAVSDLQWLLHWKALAWTLDHNSDAAFNALPGMALQDSLRGKRVMVFPNGTPYGAKIDFEMFPIYALQDYAAYTPYLDKKGASNLIDANPPVDKVLIEWIGVDGRNQFLDTPATTLAFLSHFQPESRVPDALLLQRRQTALPLSFKVIGHQAFMPGEWVPVPSGDQLIAMSIKLKQTPIGTLMTTLFDQGPVYIDLRTRSGRVEHFRVPPQTLYTPGIISYVPESLEDLEKLWAPTVLQDPVATLRLTGPGLERTTSNGYYFYQIENAGVHVER